MPDLFTHGSLSSQAITSLTSSACHSASASTRPPCLFAAPRSSSSLAASPTQAAEPRTPLKPLMENLFRLGRYRWNGVMGSESARGRQVLAGPAVPPPEDRKFASAVPGESRPTNAAAGFYRSLHSFCRGATLSRRRAAASPRRQVAVQVRNPPSLVPWRGGRKYASGGSIEARIKCACA